MTRTEKTIWIIVLILIFAAVSVFAVLFFTDRLGRDWTVRVSAMTSQPEDTVYKKIEVAYDISDYEKALNLIGDFLVDYPNSEHRGRVMVIAAKILYSRGDYEGAKNYVAKVVTIPNVPVSDFVDAVIVLGKIQKDQKINDPVILNYLEDAYLKATPDKQPEVAVYLGYAYLYKKDYNTAIRYFSISIGEQSLLGRAEVYLAGGKTAEAIQEFENIFSLYPTCQAFNEIKQRYLGIVFDFANNLRKTGQYDRAVEYYLKIVNRFPEETAADKSLLEVAGVYYEHKRLEPALSFLNLALDNNVTVIDDEALYTRGLVYYDLGKRVEAIADFKKLVERYPQSEFVAEAKEWIEVITLEFQY